MLRSEEPHPGAFRRHGSVSSASSPLPSPLGWSTNGLRSLRRLVRLRRAGVRFPFRIRAERTGREPAMFKGQAGRWPRSRSGLRVAAVAGAVADGVLALGALGPFAAEALRAELPAAAGAASAELERPGSAGPWRVALAATCSAGDARRVRRIITRALGNTGTVC